jgi:hypothetical protein
METLAAAMSTLAFASGSLCCWQIRKKFKGVDKSNDKRRFLNVTFWGQRYKTFYTRNLQKFVVS